jgi:hypothetical protein
MSGASGTTSFAIGPRSTLLLTGSSNVAQWRCTGTTLNGTMTVASPLAKINEVIARVEDGNIAKWMANPGEGKFAQPQLDLAIPIATLRCSGGRPMEHDMSRTLKADRHPAIVFHFEGLRSGVTHDIDRHEFRATIAGNLELAGTTRQIELPVTARRVSLTQFRLTAEMPVRMTDFSINPPTALFGMIKAADALTVRFDLTLEATP